MNLGLVLRRSRREWRQLGILTLALCLVTAFFALGPLYARASIQSGLQGEIATTTGSSVNLTLTSPVPFRPDSYDFINQQIGLLNTGLTRISRSTQPFGGFQYLYGEPLYENSARSAFTYRAYAFSNLRQIFKLVSGRWPNRLAPPNDPARKTNDQQEQLDRGLGIYSTGEVETVITAQVAQKTGYELGTRFVIGEKPEVHAVVNVVGIVEPVNPNDPFWDSNGTALEGETVNRGVGQTSYIMSFMVTEGAYSDWVANATRLRTGENNAYLWILSLNPTVINVDNVDNYRNKLSNLTSQLAADYPGLTINNPLLKTLNNFNDTVDKVQGPIILLSGGVLILMLYHLMTTVNLVLEQQMGEWAAMSSRGASTFQLVFLQALTMSLLGVIGFGVGPYLAYAILQGLVLIGPLAASTGGIIPIAGIPNTAFILSAIAAILAVIMLTIPAIPAARRSLAQFKQMTARPPMRPFWARYWLDLILILVGVGFIARLLFFIEGDLGQTLGLLTSNPAKLIQLILDSANRSGGLSDPLNLIGPALLLTGVALLWLRIFPLLMGLLGRIFQRSNGLTGPLSVWNVERDPGHYAQLVLLLIGTLALGTAALALGATRDQGAWTAARQFTGGAVRINFDPRQGQKTDWATLADVTNITKLTHFESVPKAGETQVFVVGIDPRPTIYQFPESFAAVSLVSGGLDQTITPASVIPVVMSERMASDEGRAAHKDRAPLQEGETGKIDVKLVEGTITFKYKIVGLTRFFPAQDEKQHFLLMDQRAALWLLNSVQKPETQYHNGNQIWLNTEARQPTSALLAVGKDFVQKNAGAVIAYAWDQYQILLRDPLPAALAGMLYAGFWVSLLLSLLDFAFYLVVTARRRSLGFAVLRALGWNVNNIWALLVAEQAALVIPALAVGVLLGVVLAYVILPFLALAGAETLRLPGPNMVIMLATLLIGFALLSLGTAGWLRRLNVNQVLRLGEEQ